MGGDGGELFPPSQAQDIDPFRSVPERFSLTDRPVEEEISGAPPLRWIEPIDSLGFDWLYAHWSLDDSVLGLGWSSGFGGYSAQLEPDSTHVYAGIPDSALVSVFIHTIEPGYELPLPDRDDVMRTPPTTPGESIDYRSLPDARALGLTRPALSGDRSTAILEYVYNCTAVMRAICGHGGFLILERRDGAWVVVTDETRWIT